MNHPSHCPHCNSLLDDGDVYEHFLEKYNDHEEALESAAFYGWSKEEPARFSRIVGVYCLERDRTTHFECPDCKGIIQRDSSVVRADDS